MTTTWRVGMACLIEGEWPGHVLEAVPHLDRYRVAYLGGTAPRGRPAEVWVVSSQLARPPGAESGRLDKLRRPRAQRHGPRGTRPWTAVDLRALRKLWTEHGATVACRLLGRSPNACKVALVRWWGSHVQCTGSRMNATAVARVLGVDSHRVVALIRRGLLAGQHGDIRAGGHSTRWEVGREALAAFLEEHPAEYEPARVSGQPWRTLAERAWAEARFLTVTEAAARLYLEPNGHGLAHKCAIGEVPDAVISHGGSDAPIRRLIPEASLPLIPIGRAAETLRARQALLTMAAADERGLLTKADMAARYGWSDGHAERMAYHEGYPHERVTVPGLYYPLLLFHPLPVYRPSVPQVWQRGERVWPTKNRRRRRGAPARQEVAA